MALLFGAANVVYLVVLYILTDHNVPRVRVAVGDAYIPQCTLGLSNARQQVHTNGGRDTTIGARLKQV
jgi:hypothetical protein